MNEIVIEGRKPGRWRALLRPAVLDRVEQVVVTIFFAFLVLRVVASDNPLAPLLALSELLVFIFVIIRRPTEAISLRFGDWLLAVTATAGSLLIVPAPSAFPVLVPAGVILVIAGNLFQLSAKLVLRRSFGIAPANRGVKLAGPYQLVRHPMYAGYFVANVGLLMIMPSLFNLAVYLITWTAQVLRLAAEERLLEQDAAYAEFKLRVRYRLVPGIY
jgi:protein-S-isoprenylcysteine O-methyltransferase Ste14